MRVYLLCSEHSVCHVAASGHQCLPLLLLHLIPAPHWVADNEAIVVATQTQIRGFPYNLALDHKYCSFSITTACEQEDTPNMPRPQPPSEG